MSAPTRYRAIVIDPPWRYKRSRGLPTGGLKPSTAEAHYPTMANEEIAALPVGELAGTDAHLYLWVTAIRMFGERGEIAPIDILTGWGFRYVTMLVWVKTGPMGMGWWWLRAGGPCPDSERIGYGAAWTIGRVLRMLDGSGKGISPERTPG